MDPVSTGSADPLDFLKLRYENVIKSDFSDLRGKFLEELRSLTPLTFGPREVPVFDTSLIFTRLEFKFKIARHFEKNQLLTDGMGLRVIYDT